MKKRIMTIVAVLAVYAVAGWEGPARAEEQKVLKSAYLLKVSEMINLPRTNKRMFAKWICIGNPAKFRARINQPAVKIAIDPSISASASYDPSTQTIYLRQSPDKFVIAFDSAPGSACLLWHEAIHAISHGHEIGAIKPPHPFKSVPTDIAPGASGKLKVTDAGGNIVPIGTVQSMTTAGNQKSLSDARAAIDHFYINWAENCLLATQNLVLLEKLLINHGKVKPSQDVAKITRDRWQRFVKGCDTSYLKDVPDAQERKELEKMIGFHCVPSEVLSGYLSLGYPIEYFGNYATDNQIWALFPTAEQMSLGGLKIYRKKNMLGKLAASYVMTWGKKTSTSGRHGYMSLTIYGSDEISKFMWDAKRKSPRAEETPIAKIGDGACLVHFDPKQSSYGEARLGNVHVVYFDEVLHGTAFEKRPVNWNFVKRVFLNIKALPIQPVPVGVETSMTKLKANN